VQDNGQWTFIRVKELTDNAGMLARKSASTADISLINILHDYANLPKENREASKAAIANNPLASPHIQDEILTKLKDVDLLIDRRQEFIDAYKQLKDPIKQQEIAEKDNKFEAEVEEVLSKPTPTEETGETKEQAEVVLTTPVTPKQTNQPFELDLNDLADISAGEIPQFDAEGNEIVSTPEVTTTEKTPVSEAPAEVTTTEEEPIARAKTSSNPREIYPGLNNTNKRNEYKLPSGDTIRTIINGYLDKGIDINTKISLRHFVNSAGKDGVIIMLKSKDGNTFADNEWIDIGNISSYTNDELSNAIIAKLKHSADFWGPNTTTEPKDLGIYFSMTEKTIQLEDKETKQPNLNQLTTDVKVNGEYLIYDRNNGGWANPYYDDSNLEIPVDFEEVDNFNKKELNNSRFVLLVPNGNKYSYVRLRNELLSNDDINSLFNELKSKAVEFKNNKDLTVDEINAFNEAINSQLFIALNPNLKVGQTLVNGSELTFKVGKFGKFQAELRYKVGNDYKSVTEYLNITDVKDMSSLLGLVNKEFKDKHDNDLNLKPNDLQQHVDLDKPETFRAATKPNVFNPNYGNQLVFDELNIEEQKQNIGNSAAVANCDEIANTKADNERLEKKLQEKNQIEESLEKTLKVVQESQKNEKKRAEEFLEKIEVLRKENYDLQKKLAFAEEKILHFEKNQELDREEINSRNKKIADLDRLNDGMHFLIEEKNKKIELLTIDLGKKELAYWGMQYGLADWKQAEIRVRHSKIHAEWAKKSNIGVKNASNK